MVVIENMTGEASWYVLCSVALVEREGQGKNESCFRALGRRFRLALHKWFLVCP